MEARISVKYRNERSLNNFTLDVLKSALQKYIRRAMEDQALFAGVELLMFGAVDGGARIVTNFIHRLQVIYLEDVGIAAINLWEYIDSKIDIMKARDLIIGDCKSLSGQAPSGQAMIDIICALSECMHNRLPSHLSAISKYSNTTSLFEGLPAASAIAKDLTMGLVEALKTRNICAAILARQFMEDEGRKITELWKILDDFGVDTALGKKWYRDLKGLKEVFLVYTTPILAYCGLANPLENNIIITRDWTDVFKVNFTSSIDFDDYIYDMHTRHGRMRGLGIKDFATEGSQVANEFFIAHGKQLRTFYERCRVYGDLPETDRDLKGKPETERDLKGKPETDRDLAGKPESSVFTFIIRAQLVCGAHKTDTYFAKMDSRIVFVKGPFKNDEAPDEVIKIYKFKKLVGLPAIEVKKVSLIPDLLETPLGVRSKIVPHTAYPFLIFDSMFPQNVQFPTEIRESKLWPPTEVVDWKKVKNCDAFNASSATEQQKKEYVRALLFRQFIGCGDLADRNFILKDGIVYSIDEDSTGKEVNFASIKSKKNKEIIEEMRQKYHTEYSASIALWKQIAGENRSLLGESLLNFIVAEKNFDFFRQL